MAMTKIADLIQNPMFTEYFQRDMVERSNLLRSGIAGTDEVIAKRCAAAGVSGKTVDMPFFNSLDGANDDEVLAEDTPLTPDKIDANKDVAVICRRGKAFAVTDLAKDLSGEDPMAAISNHLAAYWNKMRQKRLMKVLDGVFGRNVANDSSSLVLDLSANTMGKSDIMLGAQLLGDRKSELTGIIMNSAVETFLAGLDTNASLYRASDGAAVLPKYNGRDVIIDDNCPYNASTGVTTIYLFGRGAIALNPVPEAVPFETDREKLKGNDILISRIADICHLRGYKWTGTPAGVTPTNAELGTASNWAKVYEPKEIRCVKLIAKIA